MEKLDDSLRLTLRNAVNKHVIPFVRFLLPEMTNVVQGNLERRNSLSSFPLFWIPDFSNPGEEGKLASTFDCEQMWDGTGTTGAQGKVLDTDT